MEENRMEKTFSVGGMSCSGCELRIEDSVSRLPGVYQVSASFSDSCVYVSYDGNRTGAQQIKEAIEEAGYSVATGGLSARRTGPARESARRQDTSSHEVLGILVVLLGLYLLISHTVGFNFIPDINQNMSYGILFVVGLITSIHCLAMCGGINLSQNVNGGADKTPAGAKERLMPGVLYNLGRVISYTVVGGIVGAIGSVVSFSGAAKGIVAVIAGVFMMLMGLNMLNIFPQLRRFGIRMPKFLGRRLYAKRSARAPFFVGLLNGLMPCGPLQAMQLYALGTGSVIGGALSMLSFSLGTVPLMFLFGAVSSFLSSKFTHKMIRVSAVLVMVLGAAMLSRGLSLSGIQVGAAAPSGSANIAAVRDGVQEITTPFRSGRYAPITVQKGIPVKWTIQVTQADLNGCNNPVFISKYNIQQELVPGDNVIEFTPEETGTIPYSCWMGMIRSTITVVDDLAAVPKNAAVEEPADGFAAAGAAGAGGCCQVS